MSLALLGARPGEQVRGLMAELGGNLQCCVE